MTEEELAEEWVEKEYDELRYEKCERKDFIFTYYELKEMGKQAFIAGLKAKTQWHDLRENPDDLPNTDDKEHEYVVSDNLGCRMLARYYCGKWSNYGLIDNVIAWCELPTFKE